MTTTYHNALDTMFGMVKAVFDDDGLDIYGYAPDVRWPGAALANPPDRTKLWARVSLQIVTDEQASLANVNDKAFFQADGLLYVQLFCPRNVAQSLDNGRLLAEAIQNAFRHPSTDNEVWFRKAKIVELAETEENYPINVSVQYQYKTISQAA